MVESGETGFDWSSHKQSNRQKGKELCTRKKKPCSNLRQAHEKSSPEMLNYPFQIDTGVRGVDS